MLQVDIVTLFPEMFASVLEASILGRAVESGRLRVSFETPRDFTSDRRRTVDDRPYGGGPGMVLQPGPIFGAVEAILDRDKAAASATRKILLTPQGSRLDQAGLRGLVEAEWIVLVCGHYEGFDERIIQGLGFEMLSIGDFVLSGGELPAMVLLDGMARLLPGALGNEESARHESFENGLLDYPQYTRPPEFRGMTVPDVLLSGNHEEIARWRKAQALERTRRRRADLLPESQPPPGGEPRSDGREPREPDLRTTTDEPERSDSEC